MHYVAEGPTNRTGSAFHRALIESRDHESIETRRDFDPEGQTAATGHPNSTFVPADLAAVLLSLNSAHRAGLRPNPTLRVWGDAK